MAVADRVDPAGKRRLDLAARAAWLYYVKGRTQDEIAAELNVSRQNAQRLVALAGSEGLIKFRLDHALTECIELAERLTKTFGLEFCEVAPSERSEAENRVAVGMLAGHYIEGHLSQKAPLTLAFGTGRTMREAVRQVPTMDRPQHKIVSLVGNLTRDGRASHYDVVMRLSERVGAQCYPLPLPVVAGSLEERRILQAQRSYQILRALVADARAMIMGIGEIGWQAPLHVDGFITDAELGEMMERGAVGEMLGWTFDAEGRVLTGGFNDRLTAFPLTVPAVKPTVVVGAGRSRAAAIRAALKGKLANGVITDEITAAAVLDGD